MVTRLVKVGIVVGLAVGLGGCGEVPIVSDAKVWDSALLDEQQDWVLAQTDDAIAVLGQPDGWWAYFRELQWPRDREKIIGGADTENCTSGPINHRPGRLILDLSNDSFGDPSEAAMRLWEYWEAQGWDLSYIIDPSQQQDGEIDFRADRADGAMLAFGGNDIYISVSINSSCSDDPTVMLRY